MDTYMKMHPPIHMMYPKFFRLGTICGMCPATSVGLGRGELARHRSQAYMHTYIHTYIHTHIHVNELFYILDCNRIFLVVKFDMSH